MKERAVLLGVFAIALMFALGVGMTGNSIWDFIFSTPEEDLKPVGQEEVGNEEQSAVIGNAKITNALLTAATNKVDDLAFSFDYIGRFQNQEIIADLNKKNGDETTKTIIANIPLEPITTRTAPIGLQVEETGAYYVAIRVVNANTQELLQISESNTLNIIKTIEFDEPTLSCGAKYKSAHRIDEGEEANVQVKGEIYYQYGNELPPPVPKEVAEKACREKLAEQLQNKGEFSTYTCEDCLFKGLKRNTFRNCIARQDIHDSLISQIEYKIEHSHEPHGRDAIRSVADTTCTIEEKGIIYREYGCWNVCSESLREWTSKEPTE